MPHSQKVVTLRSADVTGKERYTLNYLYHLTVHSVVYLIKHTNTCTHVYIIYLLTYLLHGTESFLKS